MNRSLKFQPLFLAPTFDRRLILMALVIGFTGIGLTIFFGKPIVWFIASIVAVWLMCGLDIGATNHVPLLKSLETLAAPSGMSHSMADRLDKRATFLTGAILTLLACVVFAMTVPAFAAGPSAPPAVASVTSTVAPATVTPTPTFTSTPVPPTFTPTETPSPTATPTPTSTLEIVWDWRKAVDFAFESCVHIEAKEVWLRHSEILKATIKSLGLKDVEVAVLIDDENTGKHCAFGFGTSPTNEKGVMIWIIKAENEDSTTFVEYRKP